MKFFLKAFYEKDVCFKFAIAQLISRNCPKKSAYALKLIENKRIIYL